MNIEPEYRYLPVTSSTNQHLKTLLSECPDLNEFTVLYTDNQVAGRGQRGNCWESQNGKNLTFSILLRPSRLSASECFSLSKIVSVSILEVLSKYGEGFGIKWPNDIYWYDYKICGILIENTITGLYLDTSVVGIGINVNQEKFISSAPNPISLKNIIGQEVDRDSLLREIVTEIESRYRGYMQEPSDLIDKEYHSLLYRSKGLYPYQSRGRCFNAMICRVSANGEITLIEENGDICKYAFKEVSFVIP